jgi:hypothetical protein
MELEKDQVTGMDRMMQQLALKLERLGDKELFSEEDLDILDDLQSTAARLIRAIDKVFYKEGQ